MTEYIGSIIIWAIILVIIAIIAILFLNKFYRKANGETALLRTGFGGSHVTIDGGCIVLPILHYCQSVSLRAMPVTVRLDGTRSVITADRLRVDLELEFLVRIGSKREQITLASQALGGRVARQDGFAAVIEASLVNAIQVIVAKNSLDELHENRLGFVNTNSNSNSKSKSEEK